MLNNDPFLEVLEYVGHKHWCNTSNFPNGVTYNGISVSVGCNCPFEKL